MRSPEWMLVRRDIGLWLALGLLWALSAAAFWNGFHWVREQRDVSQRAAAAEVEEYDARKAQVITWQTNPPPPLDPVLLDLHNPRTPYAVGQAGRMAQLPLSPLTVTCIGQLDFLPLRQLVSIRTRMRTVADKGGIENPLNLLSGRFDLAFVIVYFLPLLIVAATYNLVSLEREQGTLALLRSQPTSLWRVFLTKFALRGIILIGGFVLPATLILMIGGAWREPARLAAWAGVTLAYGAFWWSLAFRINTRGYGSIANAIVLVCCWLLFVAIVPSLLQAAVPALRPTPSRLELLAAIREQSIDQRRDGRPLAEAWYSEHPDLLPAGAAPVFDTAITGTMTHIEQDRRTMPLERKFEKQVLEQQDLVSSLRFLSPAVMTNEALQDVAGSGIWRHRHFRAQVRSFREAWLAWFHARIFRRLPLEPTDYDVMPAFSYTEERTAEWLSRVWPGIAGMLAACAALLWFARRELPELS